MIRRSLDEIRARARAELWTNPTITVYAVDALGTRDVFPAYPFERWRVSFATIRRTDAFRRLGEVFVSITPSFEGFAERLRAVLEGQL